MIYETLGKVSDLQVQEGAGRNEVRLSGVFGVCGVRNNNRRVYNKENYGMMVEALQHVIETEGCPGELEHPNSMNITLENVSHKIESIQMNEDGTITGTILLLNTPKGQIAKAIVEGGLPLYISSRGAGSIDANGNVTLSTIKTYDLVGTPGFSQAKLSLNENQTFESINESADNGNIMYAIVENDEFGNKEETSTKDNKSDEGNKEEQTKSDNSEDKPEDKSDDNKNSKDKTVNMEDLKLSIDKLTERVASLEAQLHVANESLAEAQSRLANLREVNYNAIEKWIKEEFAPEFKDETISEMANYVQGWILEEFSPEVQNWIVEHFAPEVQNWVVEEFAPEVQNWIVEQYSPEVQNWVVEHFAPEIQNWIVEEFAPEVENWLKEEYTPSANKVLESKINENINAFFESQNENKFSSIDKLLESIEKSTSKEDTMKALESVQKNDHTFDGYYAVENMPAKYRPVWESLDESKKIEIARQSKMYDFTKKGVLEAFWSSVNFNSKPTQQINESVKQDSYHSRVAEAMKKLRR